jgi:hypothetical protein
VIAFVHRLNPDDALRQKGGMNGEVFPQFVLGIGWADNEYFLCILKGNCGFLQEIVRQVHVTWTHGARLVVDVASALVRGVNDSQLSQLVTCNAVNTRDVMIDPDQLMEGFGRGCHDILPFLQVTANRSLQFCAGSKLEDYLEI